MKKALLVASVASMIDQFNMNNIDTLKNLGFSVDVACNFTFGNTTSTQRTADFRTELDKLHINTYDVLIPRNPLYLNKLIYAYKQLRKIINENNYQLVHCHSPIGGVLCRLASRANRKNGLKVLYTAHGFHFFKGASLINWIVYFPAEFICSYFTDVLITINDEDTKFAEKHFRCPLIEYIPGIGIDCDSFQNTSVDILTKRKNLGISSKAIVLLSVGELNKNKNHKLIIEALAKSEIDNVYYIVAGTGNLASYLKDYAKLKKIEGRLILLGYRNDVKELLKVADIFCFPSYREGLPVSALEAMASGLPIVASDIRGVRDCCKDGENGFLFQPDDLAGFVYGIERLCNSSEERKAMGSKSMTLSRGFDLSIVNARMKDIYSKIMA